MTVPRTSAGQTRGVSWRAEQIISTHAYHSISAGDDPENGSITWLRIDLIETEQEAALHWMHSCLYLNSDDECQYLLGAELDKVLRPLL